MQRQLETGVLPAHALDAQTAFMALHLEAARALIADPDTTAIAIVLPPAPHDHRDWRLALARDLAREAAPKRVNIVAGELGDVALRDVVAHRDGTAARHDGCLGRLRYLAARRRLGRPIGSRR